MKRSKVFKYFIFNIIALIVLISLGTWQLERLQWKNKYINQIRTQISLPPMEINNDNYLELFKYRYRKVFIEGSYIYKNKIYIHSKVHNKILGKHLLVPVKTEFGYLLVNRGFVPINELNNITESSEKIKISGIINYVNKKAYFTPENDILNNDWYYININEISDYTNLNLLNFYLIEENNLAEKYPVGSQYSLNIPNDHLQYAFTWFSLAFALSIFIHIVWRKYD